MVRRAGLSDAEPDGRDGVQRGKVKRLRMILEHAIDRQPAKGARFVELFVAQVRACGGFRCGTPECPGAETVERLRAAFRYIISALTWIRKAISGRRFSRTWSGGR